MLEAARAADVLVAAEHDEGREAVVDDVIGVLQAEVDRMLGRQERDDLMARDRIMRRRFLGSVSPVGTSVP